MSTLKVNKIRDNSGSTDAIVLDPSGGAVLAGVTTVSTVKVGSGVTISSDGDVFTIGISTSSSVIVGGGVTISESGIEASGIGITCANINGGAVSGRRNMIINGDQRVAQRGTTAVLQDGTPDYRCVDRWKTDYDGSGGGNWYIAQTGTGTSIAADVPTGQGFSHSSKITVNTTVSQPTSVDYHHQFYTMLERQDVTHLEWATSAAKTCTLSFWVKGSITGTYGFWIALYGSSGGSSYYYWTNYTIDSANTWEKKVITVTGPTSGGAITSTNDLGLRIEWLLGAGSDTETGTLNEWTTSNTIRSASGTVYLPENAGATWYITGVQFEVGSVATPFEHRSFNDDYLRCCRYYFGGANTYVSGSNYYGSVYSSGNSMVSVPHPVPMRATPTASQPSQSGGGTFTQVYENSCITQYYFSGDTTVSVPAAEVDISAEL